MNPNPLSTVSLLLPYTQVTCLRNSPPLTIYPTTRLPRYHTPNHPSPQPSSYHTPSHPTPPYPPTIHPSTCLPHHPPIPMFGILCPSFHYENNVVAVRAPNARQWLVVGTDSVPIPRVPQSLEFNRRQFHSLTTPRDSLMMTSYGV